MGDQIYPQRFSVLSVRANVVCLERAGVPPGAAAAGPLHVSGPGRRS